MNRVVGAAGTAAAVDAFAAVLLSGLVEFGAEAARPVRHSRGRESELDSEEEKAGGGSDDGRSIY